MVNDEEKARKVINIKYLIKDVYKSVHYNVHAEGDMND